MSRKPLSKRVRFEVFKRDSFTCQYCGLHPPTVVLHVDHVHPVAEGGNNEIDNLITACEGCNQGKGARLLSQTPPSLTDKSEELREREAQIKGYTTILRERAERLEDETWQVAEVLSPGCGESGFNRRNLLSIKQFLERMPSWLVIEAAEMAYSRIRFSDYQRFRYFCGICWKKLRDADG
jgi:HNH endonuclease